MANFAAKSDAVIHLGKTNQDDFFEDQKDGSFFAQFGLHFGMSKMQNSLQHSSTSLLSNQALQASALVGRSVLVLSDNLVLCAKKDAILVLDIVSGLSQLSLTIYSQSGELVRLIQLGEPETGFFQFHWDGRGEDQQRRVPGVYKVRVKGFLEEKEIWVKTMAVANVNSVSMGLSGEGLKLNVSDIGLVSLDQVKKIMI